CEVQGSVTRDIKKAHPLTSDGEHCETCQTESPCEALREIECCSHLKCPGGLLCCCENYWRTPMSDVIGAIPHTMGIQPTKGNRMSTPVTLDSLIYAPDSIRGGANPTTSTVANIIDETYRFHSAVAGSVLADVAERAGIEISDDNSDLHLDSPRVAEH